MMSLLIESVDFHKCVLFEEMSFFYLMVTKKLLFARLF